MKFILILYFEDIWKVIHWILRYSYYCYYYYPHPWQQKPITPNIMWTALIIWFLIPYSMCNVIPFHLSGHCWFTVLWCKVHICLPVLHLQQITSQHCTLLYNNSMQRASHIITLFYTTVTHREHFTALFYVIACKESSRIRLRNPEGLNAVWCLPLQDDLGNGWATVVINLQRILAQI